MEITIIYGTETGNSESLAQDARAKLTKLGHQAKVVDMEGITVEQLKNAGTLLVITSTWGDGEPPTNAEALHQELKDSSEDLSEVSYAVFALGDGILRKLLPGWQGLRFLPGTFESAKASAGSAFQWRP